MGEIDANCIQALDKLPGTTQGVDLDIADNRFPQNSQNLTAINPQTPLFLPISFLMSSTLLIFSSHMTPAVVSYQIFSTNSRCHNAI